MSADLHPWTTSSQKSVSKKSVSKKGFPKKCPPKSDPYSWTHLFPPVSTLSGELVSQKPFHPGGEGEGETEVAAIKIIERSWILAFLAALNLPLVTGR